MILVTGGTGYIGSHTVVELINDGQEVVIIDDLSNSNEIAIEKIEQITGKKPIFYKGSIFFTPNKNSICYESKFYLQF